MLAPGRLDLDMGGHDSSNCIPGLPLKIMGLDFNLVTDMDKLSLNDVNNIKKVFKILLNNNIKTSSNTTSYLLNKNLEQILSKYKKTTGLSITIIELLKPNVFMKIFIRT